MAVKSVFRSFQSVQRLSRDRKARKARHGKHALQAPNILILELCTGHLDFCFTTLTATTDNMAAATLLRPTLHIEVLLKTDQPPDVTQVVCSEVRECITDNYATAKVGQAITAGVGGLFKGRQWRI